MNNKSIILKEKFDNSISSRAAIKNLFNFDTDALKELAIDFSDIVFISSSVAHQLVMELRKLESLDIEVNFLNINEDVQRMINIAKTDRKNIFTTQPIEVIDTPSEKELDEFLTK
ncbi:MAG: STAS domain-containing protein [Chlorobi bacterium]|nr:STAS domain-containing protein [Chlorobiota bacterium]